MKIYIVNHHQDNGLSYEDHDEWDAYDYFSTWEKAYAYYCDKICDDYNGSYSIIEITLDTQENIVLEKSPFGGYTNMYYEDEHSYDDDVDNIIYTDNLYDEYDYSTLKPKEYRSHAFQYNEQDESWLDGLEQMEEEEWLKTPHEQYEPLMEIEKDREAKNLLELLGLLNEALAS